MTRICILLLLAAVAIAQETFHIAGSVVNSQTGQPIKGAVVTLRGGFQPGKPPVVQRPREMLTDAAGRFSADALPAGPFNLSAEKNGFLANYSSDQITLGPSRDGLALSLTPLGVITGRVTDTDGDPVPFASVRAVTGDLRDGRRIYRQVRSVSTDDQGRYRMWNFAPGEYYIATAGRTGGTQATVSNSLSTGAGGPPAFAPVYFPNAADRASATPITVAPGQEFTADLRVRMETSYRIRGMLRGAAPYQPVQVELLRGPNDLNATRAVVNSATGRFEVREVVPGNYLLRATQSAGGHPIRGELPLQVTKADISGIVIDLLPGVKVAGVVHAPPPDPAIASRIRPGRVASVRLIPVDDPASFNYPNTFAGEQGEFTFDPVPAGRYRLVVMPIGGYVASAVSGTRDLLREELSVVAGVPPERIVVDVRNDGGAVSVTTETSEGSLLLVPVGGGEVQRGPVLPAGFRFESLAPGQYTLYWLKDPDKFEFRNPDFLRALRGGVTFSVTARGVESVTLKEMAQ